ncbi:MAG: GNAT family N-acetyltransferase, partial [Ilumatobacteraceae bacterium]|nr:GNAT family N-acetyltransferase [Ilumatobacteraceae bacterium]
PSDGAVDEHHVLDVQHQFLRQAAGCLVRAAFSMRGIEFVEARHDVANLASRRVPERLGFTFVGERAATVGAPAETGTDWVWRLDRADWKQTQES